MEKTLIIDGRPVHFKATAAFALRYRNQFNRDALQDLAMLEKTKDKDGNIDMTKVDLMVLYNLAWALAKTADPSLPEPLEWLDSFSTFPLADVMPELVGMMTSTMIDIKDREKEDEKEKN